MDGNSGINNAGVQPALVNHSQKPSNATGITGPGRQNCRTVVAVPPNAVVLIVPPGSFVKVDISNRQVAITTVTNTYIKPPISPEVRQNLFSQGAHTLAQKGYTPSEADGLARQGFSWAENNFGSDYSQVENSFMGWVSNAPDRADNPSYQTASGPQADTGFQKIGTAATPPDNTATAVDGNVAGDNLVEDLGLADISGVSVEVEGDTKSIAAESGSEPPVDSNTPASGSVPGVDGVQSAHTESIASAQTMTTGEDYSELEGVPELFVEPGDSSESAAVDRPETDDNTMAKPEGETLVDSNLSASGAVSGDGGAQSVQTESIASAQTMTTGEDYSELDGVSELFAEPDDSSESAAVDRPETDDNTMAKPEGETLVDSNLSASGAVSGNDGAQSVQTESIASAQTMTTGEDYSELDGVSELFAEPKIQDSPVLTSPFVPEVSMPSIVSIDSGDGLEAIATVSDEKQPTIR